MTANCTLVALNVSEQLYAWGYVLVSGTAFRTLSEEIAGQLVHGILRICGLAFTRWLEGKRDAMSRQC